MSSQIGVTRAREDRDRGSVARARRDLLCAKQRLAALQSRIQTCLVDRRAAAGRDGDPDLRALIFAEIMLLVVVRERLTRWLVARQAEHFRP